MYVKDSDMLEVKISHSKKMLVRYTIRITLVVILELVQNFREEAQSWYWNWVHIVCLPLIFLFFMR